MYGCRKPWTLVLWCILLFQTAWTTAASQENACSLEDVRVLFPANGSTYYLREGVDAISLMLIAEVNCIYDTYQVTFALDDTTVESDLEAPYIVSCPDLCGLSSGTHTAVAAASSIYTPGLVVEDTATFNLQEPAADLDVDGNGIPDDPFTTLAQDGDAWTEAVDVPETGATRRVVLVRWDGAEAHGSVAISLTDPAAPSLGITVTVPGELLDEGETGILLVAAAPNRETLLGPIEGPRLGCEAPGEQVSGSAWVEVSVLVTTDGGATFDEIEDARLVAHPIHLSMEGLTPQADREQGLYHHTTLVESHPDTGIYIAAECGQWSAVPNAIIASGRLDADLVSLSVFTVREEDDCLNAVSAQAILVTLALLTPTISILSEGDPGGGGPCFIATAAYGTPLARDIDVLRSARDAWLLNNAAGAAAADIYYRVSPTMAGWVSRNPVLGAGIRLVLVPVVACCRLLLAVQWPVPTLAVGTVMLFVAAVRRKRKRGAC